MKKFISTIIFLLLYHSSISILSCQIKNTNSYKTNFELGASIESSILFSTKKIEDFQKEESLIDAYPISLYLHGTFFLTEDFGIELKPGWIFGGEPFTAIEFGFYLKHYFLKQKMFGSTGINIHKNLPVGHGTFSSTDESVFLFGIIIGYNPISNLTFNLGYYNPLSEYLYFTDLNDRNDEYFSVFLNRIIKFGLEINF